MKAPTPDWVAPAPLRPGYEGANIRTWIGFKHFMYLMEEAAVQHVRERWGGPGALWREHGLGVEIVDSSIRILTALHLDQLTRVEVRPREGDREYELAATLEARNDGRWAPAASGGVRVLFRRSAEGAGALPREHAAAVISSESKRNEYGRLTFSAIECSRVRTSSLPG